MADPFLGEIRPVGYNFAPRGWAFCAGQIISIAQNTALFSLLGTTYGGNGQTTFALPDLQGRVPISEGQGPGLQGYSLGEQGGVNTVTLTTAQLPAHRHSAPATGAAADAYDPSGHAPAIAPRQVYGSPAAGAALASSAVAPAGGGVPHNNLMPYLVISYVIALQGVFPSRN